MRSKSTRHGRRYGRYEVMHRRRRRRALRKLLRTCMVLTIGVMSMFLLVSFSSRAGNGSNFKAETLDEEVVETSQIYVKQMEIVQTSTTLNAQQVFSSPEENETQELQQDTITEDEEFIQDEEIEQDEELIQEEEITQEEVQENTQEVEQTDYVYFFSHQEKIVMAKVVYGESRGEPFEGKVAVAAVLINRLHSNNSFFAKDSIISIATQKNQFCDISWITEEMLESVPSCMEAVEAACKGMDPTREVFENGALFFYRPDRVSDYQLSIRQGVEQIVIGHHNFHVAFNN